MTINRPEADLPRGLRGGSDTWDTGPAGVVLRDDWFQTAVGSATGALAATESGSDTLVASGTSGGGSSTPITFTSHGPYDNQPGAGATATSASISYTAGQPIIVEAGSSDTLTVSDSNGLTWQILDASLPLYFAANQEYQYVWYAIPASSGTTAITVTRASSGSYFGFLVSTYESGAGTPLLKSTGSVGSYTASATAFSNTITPTTSGSAVWTSYFTGGGSGPPTMDSGSAIYSNLVIAGNRTHFRLGKSTEPLTSSASVTISGLTDTGFQYAQWINYEVPATSTGGGGGGATGTLSATEAGADVFAASGTVTPSGATGSLAATESGSDIAAAAGVALAAGALAVSETAIFDTFGSTATTLAQGQFAANEVGADVAAISVAALAQGSLSATESAADVFAGSGSLALLAGTGTLAAVESGSDVAAASGSAIAAGSLAVSETAIFDTFGSTAASLAQGQLAGIEVGSDIAAVSVSALAQGSIAAVETGLDTFAATGGAPLPAATGTLSAVETGLDVASFLAGELPAQPTGPSRAGSGPSRSSGPDAQVSLSDYLRRFGPKAAAPGRTRQQDDDEALALILCALAAESLTAPQF